MKRRDTEIWTDGPEGRQTAAPDGKPVRRKDTDLGEPSVRKSRRQLRKEELEAERVSQMAAADERAPWDDPADPAQALQRDTNLPRTSPQDPAQALPTAAPEQQPAAGERKKSPNTFASVLSGNILSRSEVTRAYPYMIFVACLMFLYIANIFRTQYIYREHARLTEQVKELRAKSMTIASEKMQATRQSSIMVELERRGIPLRESLTPNKVIPNPLPHGEETDDR